MGDWLPRHDPDLDWFEASIPIRCLGCGATWGSFNVPGPRKCRNCAVYGTPDASLVEELRDA